MKNLLLLLALIFTNQLFSQTKTNAPSTDQTKQKFSLGILAGLNINFMPYDHAPAIRGGSHNSRLLPEYAYFAGVSARQPIFNHLAVKLDGQFSRRGFGLKSYSSPFPVLEHYQASYVDFVPQVEYIVFKNIFLSLGGYGGVRLEEEWVKYNNQDWTILNPDFIVLAEDSDWGLMFGLRVEFGRFSALIKYQHGLTPGIKWELMNDIGEITKSSQYHRSLQIGLGFNLI
ncbi:MAG: outer membrane beta-barrel protein [Saprospiraceae bacterium]|nr:outer membrane beta-barrel protein [Saprospiraceae bacterium]